MFFRSDGEEGSSGEPKLGFRSTLVLAKLGHDLRQQFNATLNEPMAPELEQALERLVGPGAAIEALDGRKRPKLQS